MKKMTDLISRSDAFENVAAKEKRKAALYYYWTFFLFLFLFHISTMPSATAGTDTKRHDKEKQKAKQKQVFSQHASYSFTTGPCSPLLLGCVQLTEALQAVQKTIKAANQVCHRHKLYSGGGGKGGCRRHSTTSCLHIQDPDILQKFPVFASYSRGDFTSNVSFKHAAQLSEEQKSTIYDIFEANMKDIYSKDSQKWNPKEKRRELFDVRRLSAPLNSLTPRALSVC